MEIIKIVLWVLQVVSALAIIVLVLLQHGKGADAGATFGSGSGSGSLFGASGSANFLSRSTAVFAVIFFAVTFGLVLVSGKGRIGDAGVMANLNGKKVVSTTIVSSAPAITKMVSSQVVSSAPAKGKPNQIPG